MYENPGSTDLKNITLSVCTLGLVDTGLSEVCLIKMLEILLRPGEERSMELIMQHPGAEEQK